MENWNVEKIKELLYDNIEKIAKMRATDNCIGTSSIAGLVVVRIFPDYRINIEYGQSGATDGYSDRLWFEFPRANVFDIIEDIKPNEDGTYWDELNKTTLSWDEVVQIALDEGLWDDTQILIDEQLQELIPTLTPPVYYLNYNIEKVESLLLDPETIRKIAKLRADAGDLFPQSVDVLIYPNYSIDITSIQGDNNYKETDRLELSFNKENIWDHLDNIKDNNDGTYYDEENDETFSLDDLIDLVVTNGKDNLYDTTKWVIEEFISNLKEKAEKCPHCGSYDIQKRGKEIHTDGEHQRYQCKVCHHYFVSEWTLR